MLVSEGVRWCGTASRTPCLLPGVADGRADGAAMGDGNDVPAFMGAGQAVDDRGHPHREIDKAFTTRCPGFRRGQPEGVLGIKPGIDLLAFLSLPFTEILFGEIFLDMRVGQDQPGFTDGIGGLVSALQMRGNEQRVFGQELCERLVGRRIVDIGQRVGIAVDASTGRANGGVAGAGARLPGR